MRELLCLLILATVLASSAYAQRSSSPSPPLVMTLAISKTRLCTDEKIPVSFSLKNISKATVAVDKNSVRYSSSWSAVPDPMPLPLQKRVSGRARAVRGMGTGMAGSSVGDPGPGYTGDLMALSPLQVFRASGTHGGFEKPGRYRLRYTYGQFQDDTLNGITVWRGGFDSNEVSFRIVSCRKNTRTHFGQKQSEQPNSIGSPTVR
jgi:hypothetical protein